MHPPGSCAEMKAVSNAYIGAMRGKAAESMSDSCSVNPMNPPRYAPYGKQQPPQTGQFRPPRRRRVHRR